MLLPNSPTSWGWGYNWKIPNMCKGLEEKRKENIASRAMPLVGLDRKEEMMWDVLLYMTEKGRYVRCPSVYVLLLLVDE